VVRNFLLIIDFIQDYQHQGYTLDDAVREAGSVRLRPILLTTVTILFGVAPMVPDPVFGGLAIALIFGAINSALLAVFIVQLTALSAHDDAALNERISITDSFIRYA